MYLEKDDERVYINWKEVERLAICNCSIEETASFLGINKTTLFKRIKVEYGMDWKEYKQLKYHKRMAMIKSIYFEKIVQKNDKFILFAAERELDLVAKTLNKNINVEAGKVELTAEEMQKINDVLEGEY